MDNTTNLHNIVPIEYRGNRLDWVLSQLFPHHSRSRLQSWLKQGYVLINGENKPQRYKVQGGETIIITAPAENHEEWVAESIPLNIVYEDNDIIVINKPIGLVVHPGAGVMSGTLLNALLHYDPALSQVPRAGIIHRLDKDTSGLLIIARNLVAHTELVRQLQAREFEREYVALVQGQLRTPGKIDLPIARHPHHRTRMAVTEQGGKEAITHYFIEKRFPAHTLLTVKLETGRTHQIRVHLSHLGYPIVGDPVYGGRLRLPKNASEQLITQLKNYRQQALHARKLAIIHPRHHVRYEWFAEIPACFAELLNVLTEDNSHS
ncbi:MAG: 23S rRNA pseudouridine(1911/1915/1917) synthase RluD [Legionellales bacterium]|nr:23S rRNA pseudouridine(1911/1915/1917) synthase RluD [Legionellales bacterium]